MPTHSQTPASMLAEVANRAMRPLTPSDVAMLTDPLTGAEKRKLRDVLNIDGILNDPALAISPRIYRTAIGSLRALGYPREWLAEVLGRPVEDIRWKHGRNVPRDLMVDALTVAARIGDRPATPDVTGLSPDQIAVVTSDARRDHYYPPIAYDEWYTYIEGCALLGRQAVSPDMSRDGIAGRRIKALAHFARHGGSARELSARFGFDRRTFGRYTSDLGLRSEVSDEDEGRVVRPAPGQDALLDAIVATAEAVESARGRPTQLWADLVAKSERIRAAVITTEDIDAAAA